MLLLLVILLCFRALAICKYEKTERCYFRCGATLITSLHALTAHHCAVDSELYNVDPCSKPDFSKGDLREPVKNYLADFFR